jgi:hypothetical protein
VSSSPNPALERSTPTRHATCGMGHLPPVDICRRGRLPWCAAAVSSHHMSCHCRCHGRDGDWTCCYRVQRSSASQTRTETGMLHDSCRGRVACFPFSAPCLPFPGMLREGGTQPPFSSLPVSGNASLRDEGQLAVGTPCLPGLFPGRARNGALGTTTATATLHRSSTPPEQRQSWRSSSGPLCWLMARHSM